MTQEFEISDDDLPIEVHHIIKQAIKKYKKFKKLTTKEEVKPRKRKEKGKEEKKLPFKVSMPEDITSVSDKSYIHKVLTHRYSYIAIISVAIVLVIIIIAQIIP